MAQWRIWLKDQREPLLDRAEAKRALSIALGSHRFELVRGPLQLVPPERYPGQWVFDVYDPDHFNGKWAKLKLANALESTRFGLVKDPTKL